MTGVGKVSVNSQPASSANKRSDQKASDSGQEGKVGTTGQRDLRGADF